MNPPLTDVRDATEVWVAIRRHFLNADHKPCDGCGKRAYHSLLGIGVASGKVSAEEMARNFCRTEFDVIFPTPVNVAFWDEAHHAIGGYCPVTGEPYTPETGGIHDTDAPL